MEGIGTSRLKDGWDWWLRNTEGKGRKERALLIGVAGKRQPAVNVGLDWAGMGWAELGMRDKLREGGF